MAGLRRLAVQARMTATAILSASAHGDRDEEGCEGEGGRSGDAEAVGEQRPRHPAGEQPGGDAEGQADRDDDRRLPA